MIPFTLTAKMIPLYTDCTQNDSITIDCTSTDWIAIDCTSNISIAHRMIDSHWLHISNDSIHTDCTPNDSVAHWLHVYQWFHCTLTAHRMIRLHTDCTRLIGLQSTAHWMILLHTDWFECSWLHIDWKMENKRTRTHINMKTWQTHHRLSGNLLSGSIGSIVYRWTFITLCYLTYNPS